MTEHLGVYALGSADAAERLLVEDHLPGCSICRANLERLAPLPDLLAKVPRDLVPGTSRRSAQRRAAARAGRPARAWRVVTATAAAAFAAGAWLVPHSTAPTPADVTLSAADASTHVRATAALTGTSWGTSIKVTADGIPRNEVCWLVIHSRTGRSEVSAYWDAWSPGPITVPASAAWRPSDISSMQVVTKSAVLVTLTAVPVRPKG